MLLCCCSYQAVFIYVSFSLLRALVQESSHNHNNTMTIFCNLIAYERIHVYSLIVCMGIIIKQLITDQILYATTTTMNKSTPLYPYKDVQGALDNMGCSMRCRMIAALHP